MVRSKFLEALPLRVPYDLRYKLVQYEVNENDILTIQYEVICERESLVRWLVGKDGKTIVKIATELNQELRNLFQRDVYLKLSAKAEKKK